MNSSSCVYHHCDYFHVVCNVLIETCWPHRRYCPSPGWFDASNPHDRCWPPNPPAPIGIVDSPPYSSLSYSVHDLFVQHRPDLYVGRWYATPARLTRFGSHLESFNSHTHFVSDLGLDPHRSSSYISRPSRMNNNQHPSAAFKWHGRLCFLSSFAVPFLLGTAVGPLPSVVASAAVSESKARPPGSSEGIGGHRSFHQVLLGQLEVADEKKSGETLGVAVGGHGPVRYFCFVLYLLYIIRIVCSNTDPWSLIL